MGKEELRFQIVLPVTLTTSITFYLAWHSSPCKGLTNSYKCLSWVNKSSLWEKHHISKNVRSPKKWNVITLTKVWSCSSGPRRSSTQITLAERPSSFPWPVPAFVRRRREKKKKIFWGSNDQCFSWLPSLSHTRGQVGSTEVASDPPILLAQRFQTLVFCNDPTLWLSIQHGHQHKCCLHPNFHEWLYLQLLGLPHMKGVQSEV